MLWLAGLPVCDISKASVWAESLSTFLVTSCLGSNLTSIPLFFHSGSSAGAWAESVRNLKTRWLGRKLRSKWHREEESWRSEVWISQETGLCDEWDDTWMHDMKNVKGVWDLEADYWDLVRSRTQSKLLGGNACCWQRLPIYQKPWQVQTGVAQVRISWLRARGDEIKWTGETCWRVWDKNN